MEIKLKLDDNKIKVIAIKAAVDLYGMKISFNQKEFEKSVERNIQKMVKENFFDIIKSSLEELE
jgi:hypothetical protein